MFNKKNKEKEEKKRTTLSKILNIIKWICIGIVSFIIFGIVAVLIIRAIGVAVNRKTPKGGINESQYIEINNSTQWIAIYGKDINNPVILHLHGGPGGASSIVDYKYLHLWSDVFTVVSWDQRNCGLSYSDDQNDIPLTYDLFMKDGLEITKYLTKYLNKDKIALVGHSWGTFLGANLALEYPEYYDFYIGSGQLIDSVQNEVAFINDAKKWSKGDKEGEKMVAKMEEKMKANNWDNDYLMNRGAVIKRYGYDYSYNGEKRDFNAYSAIFFNPYYSISDIYKNYYGKDEGKNYDGFWNSEEYNKFSLLNRTEYQIPYYNINGDHDYNTNNVQAEEYFKLVKAPRKNYYTMKDMAHGLLEVRSHEYSDLIHEIAKIEQTNSTIAVN